MAQLKGKTVLILTMADGSKYFYKERKRKKGLPDFEYTPPPPPPPPPLERTEATLTYLLDKICNLEQLNEQLKEDASKHHVSIQSNDSLKAIIETLEKKEDGLLNEIQIKETQIKELLSGRDISFADLMRVLKEGGLNPHYVFRGIQEIIDMLNLNNDDVIKQLKSRGYIIYKKRK